MKIGGSFTSIQTQTNYFKKKSVQNDTTSENKVITSEVTSKEEDENNLRIAYLSNKLQGGQELTKEELDFLEKYAPSVKSSAMDAKKERDTYRESLERCKSKEEVNSLKLGKELDYYAKIKKAKKEGKEEEVNKLIMYVNTIQNEHNKFIQTKEFIKLPEKDEKDKNNSYINRLNDYSYEEVRKKRKEEKEKRLGIDISI